jgi:aspartyl-tRNA(Asn)/glutamyl-tRNA(Gln) amidotransferase subunit B
MPAYRPVIGLEIHARLLTRSKLFCACANRYGDPPNTLTCPVCLGLPGALPVANRAALMLGIRASLAVGAQIAPVSVFARKHYFYPDLPKGYQITQHDRPLALGGRVRLEPEEGPPRWIPLSRLHLEEDAGKSVHEGLPRPDRTGLDFNRCGAPLLEIVSEPALASPEEAGLFLERLRTILRDAGVSDADMEKGSLRADANVSLATEDGPAGPRVELKNLNSIRFVRRALAHEVQRQAARLEAGEGVRRETRRWNESRRQTEPLRGKEEAEDYRYFSDPDLPPLVVEPDWIEEQRDFLPEPAHLRRDRFVDELGLRVADAHRLAGETALADYFELVAEASGAPRAAAGWVLNELLPRLGRSEEGIAGCSVDPESLADLLRRVDGGELSHRAAREVFARIFESEEDPETALLALGLRDRPGEEELRARLAEVVAAHPEQARLYREGKKGLLDFLVGRALAATEGKADPSAVRELLERLLRGGGS